MRLDEDVHMVASNDREAVAKAVGYLIGQGHRRIGFVAGPEGFRSAAERALGYRDALDSAGVAIDETIMAEGNYTFETGIAAGEKLLAASPRPSAIFASNDEMAAGVLHAARSIGMSVPEDLSIIGFDDTAIAAHIWPPLTTVRWPIQAMAKAAAIKLIAPVEARDQPSHFLSDLIERASVAPL